MLWGAHPSTSAGENDLRLTALDVPAKDLSLRRKDGKRTSTQEAPHECPAEFCRSGLCGREAHALAPQVRETINARLRERGLMFRSGTIAVCPGQWAHGAQGIVAGDAQGASVIDRKGQIQAAAALPNLDSRVIVLKYWVPPDSKALFRDPAASSRVKLPTFSVFPRHLSLCPVFLGHLYPSFAESAYPYLSELPKSSYKVLTFWICGHKRIRPPSLPRETVGV